MNRLFIVAASAFALMLPAVGANAVDITNSDQATYQVTVHTGEETTKRLEILAGQTLQNVCSEDCMLSLDGQDGVYVSDNQIAVLTNGKIQLQTQ